MTRKCKTRLFSTAVSKARNKAEPYYPQKMATLYYKNSNDNNNNNNGTKISKLA